MADKEKRGAPPSGSSEPKPSSPALDQIAQQFAQADAGWEAELRRHPKWDHVLPTLPNVYKILRKHPEWEGVIAYDEFAGVVTKRKPPPFEDGADLGEWTDNDDGRLALWLALRYEIEPKDAVLMRAVMGVADANHFHPVRDYLKRLVWDEKPRLDYWLCAYLGAVPQWYELSEEVRKERHMKVARFITDDPQELMKKGEGLAGKLAEYTAAVGSRFLIGAVARVMRPGVKMDNVLILEGLQYLGKSSALRVLAQPWYTDQQIKIGDKDTYETMRGQWFVEMPELDAFNKTETTSAKAFFSRSQDRFRSFYGRRAANVPRQCVFSGTVNHFTYLIDESGNRRYWPVKCTRVDLGELEAERDQIWAEALHRFEAGEPWWVQSEEKPMFDAEAEARYVGDAWEARIRAWLEEPDAGGFKRTEASMDQLLAMALHLDTSKWTRSEHTRVGKIMERIGGWRHVRPDENKPRVYRRDKDIRVDVGQPAASVQPPSSQPRSGNVH